MPKVPFVPRPASVAPSVPEEYLLMAAATMHEMGRLVEAPPPERDVTTDIRRLYNDVPMGLPQDEPLSSKNDQFTTDQGAPGRRTQMRSTDEHEGLEFDEQGFAKDYDQSKPMSKAEAAARQRIRQGLGKGPIRISPHEFEIYRLEEGKYNKEVLEKQRTRGGYNLSPAELRRLGIVK